MKNDDLSAPYVAIAMITYNHGKFIEQAIESVMVQETTFSYKLFIGEDCSTDDTRELCIKMKQKYPDKIELVLNEKNLGHSLNGFTLFHKILNSGARYSAGLDGDDYWIGKSKLQSQIDILDKNPGLTICFTQAYVLKESTQELITELNDSGIPDRLDFDNFIEKGNPYKTATSVLRLECLPKQMPNWFNKVVKQDWVLYVMLLNAGDAYYLRQVTGVYRVHGGGVIKSTSSINLAENSAFLIRNMMDYFYPHRQKQLGNALTWTYFHLAFDYWNNYRVFSFFKNIISAAQTGEKKSAGWYRLVLKKMALDIPRKIYHKIAG